MTVQQVLCDGLTVDVEGAGYAPLGRLAIGAEALPPGDLATRAPAVAALAEAAALCNDASLHEQDGRWQLAGDPTEGALLTLALKAGLNPAELGVERPRLDVIPFESEHRFMATLHAANGSTVPMGAASRSTPAAGTRPSRRRRGPAGACWRWRGGLCPPARRTWTTPTSPPA
ncbi:MAG: hypothetical protein MUC74_16490 [Ideonella sp.]|nr:hypothetical protein [Ideonella sp.]